jgi:cobalamin biosynthesis protein CobW
LPKPLVKPFYWPYIRAKLTVDGVIAVVDSAAVADGRFADDEEKLAGQRALDPSLDHDNPLEEVYEDQLLCADLILLNKADLLDEAALEKVRAEIVAAVPRAVKIVPTREGRLDVDVLLGLAAAAEDDLAARPSHHDDEEGHDHDDFDSFVAPLPSVADPAALSEKLAAIARDYDVLRMKGFVEVSGKPMRLLVQGVGGRFSHQFDRPWRAGENRSGRLVVIGQKGFDRAAVEAALSD